MNTHALSRIATVAAAGALMAAAPRPRTPIRAIPGKASTGASTSSMIRSTGWSSSPSPRPTPTSRRSRCAAACTTSSATSATSGLAPTACCKAVATTSSTRWAASCSTPPWAWAAASTSPRPTARARSRTTSAPRWASGASARPVPGAAVLRLVHHPRRRRPGWRLLRSQGHLHQHQRDRQRAAAQFAVGPERGGRARQPAGRDQHDRPRGAGSVQLRARRLPATPRRHGAGPEGGRRVRAAELRRRRGRRQGRRPAMAPVVQPAK